MFRGYFKAEQTYKGKFVGGYYLTGDRGSVDGDGYYWFVGRDDDVINTAGTWWDRSRSRAPCCDTGGGRIGGGE